MAKDEIKNIKKNIKKAHREQRRERLWGRPILKYFVDKTKDDIPSVEITYDRYKSDQKTIFLFSIMSLFFVLLGIIQVLCNNMAYTFSLAMAVVYIFQVENTQNHQELLAEKIFNEYDKVTTQEMILELAKDLDKKGEKK